MAENKTFEKFIDDIITKTFKELIKVYKGHKEVGENDETVKCSSRIIFPKYKDKSTGQNEQESDSTNESETRISEQELRFVFVEEFNKKVTKKKLNYFYSIETPTQKSYVFSRDKDCPRVAKEEENGVSARTDLVIYEKVGKEFKKVALIEFKAHNPVKKSYQKDILKLIEEKPDSKQNGNDYFKYFIQIINDDKEKFDNEKPKIEKRIKSLFTNNKDNNLNGNYKIEYWCCNLSNENMYYTGTITEDAKDKFEIKPKDYENNDPPRY